MIRPTPKEKNSIYHDSFYQYKKRTSPLKWLLLVISWLIFAVVCISQSMASTIIQPKMHKMLSDKPPSLNQLGAGELMLKPTDNLASGINTDRQNSALLVNSHADFDINGLVATVTLTQSFINQSNQTVNGLYAFPLPENATVNYLHIQVGQRVIEGKIMEKLQAKKVFARAKRSGKKASLIEQHRPNLFTNQIANIAPNEQITVTLKYFQHINYSDDKFTLRFPMSITPRYQPTPQTEPTKHNALPHIFSAKRNQPHPRIQLEVNLNAGVELASITSPSHPITVNDLQSNNPVFSPYAKQSALHVAVGNIQVAMDRDFILQWQPTLSNEPRVNVFTQTLNNEHYALAMVIPPSQLANTEQQAFARDITFIIDTSGSMQGQSIEQAKQSLLFALQTLTEHDSFNIIAFESSYRQAFGTTVMATSENLFRARQFISKLQANGGTEMHQPLAKALGMPSASTQTSEAIKQIIFITDGAVSNELALFKLIHSTRDMPRLFTVGIGAAPNGYFMRKAAQFGRGSYTYISQVGQVNAKMADLLEKISRPALRDINVQFQPLHLGSIEQYPKKIPDLYQGEPLLVAFKTAQMPQSMQLFGEQANRAWHHEVNFTLKGNNQGITPIWAKAKIEDLLDGLVTGQPSETVKKQVLATSLLHQVMSPYSSFIAVEQDNNVDAKNPAQAKTPFPKTAVGWKAPFITGVLLLIFSLILQARRSQLTRQTPTKKVVNSDLQAMKPQPTEQQTAKQLTTNANNH